MVETRPSPQGVVDVPVWERPVQEPRVVEGGIADARITPVDYSDESSVADEQVLGPEVGVKECRFEAHEHVHFAEELVRTSLQLPVDERKDEPFELGALFAVGRAPVIRLEGQLGQVDRVARCLSAHVTKNSANCDKRVVDGLDVPRVTP
jgi:hypothetical protein